MSWLWITKLRWRVGSAVVRMGGIGGVGTDRAHRRQGYSRRCMDTTLELMRRERMPMLALFGIPGFYDKWGFAPVIPEPRLTLATADALRAEAVPGLRAVAFRDARHARAARRLHDAVSRRRSGVLVNRWPTRRLRKGSDWFVRSAGLAVETRAGRLAAYAVFDKDKPWLTVTEAAWAKPGAFPALTRALGRLARARRLPHVDLLLPADDPYALFLRRWNVVHAESHFADGQGMARIVDLPATLRACAGEFSRRLAASRFHDRTAVLRFVTDTGSAALVIRRGRVRVDPDVARGATVRLPQTVLTQWLLGARPVEPPPAGVRAARGIRPFLAALFPTGHPFVHHADRF